MIRVGLVIGCLIGFPAISSAGPIINESFEDPDCGVAGNCSAGSWGLFASIPGWSAGVGGGPIEIGHFSNYGVTGYDGDQVLELDSTGNAIVSQIVAGPGAFTLSFLYADRQGGVGETFNVFWNNVLIASLAPNSTVMALYTTNVIAVGGNNTLAFVGTGVSDSYGALIDKVQLESVPDGGLTAVLLGMSIVGMRRLRRMID